MIHAWHGTERSHCAFVSCACGSPGELGGAEVGGDGRTLTLRSRHFRQDCCGRILVFESEVGIAIRVWGERRSGFDGNSVMMGPGL